MKSAASVRQLGLRSILLAMLVFAAIFSYMKWHEQHVLVGSWEIDFGKSIQASRDHVASLKNHARNREKWRMTLEADGAYVRALNAYYRFGKWEVLGNDGNTFTVSITEEDAEPELVQITMLGDNTIRLVVDNEDGTSATLVFNRQ